MDIVEVVEEKLRRYVAPNYAPFAFVPTRCEGCWIEGYKKGDENPRWILDMVSTYSALSLGHNDIEITRLKIKRLQDKKPSKTARGILMHEELADLAKFLCSLCGMDMMIPKNGGTEAFDTAVHAARMWKWKVRGGIKDGTNIIVCEKNFHGRSGLARDASSEPSYRDGFGPYPVNSFKKIPFGDIRALEAAITPMTAAFITEPIQAEGGMIFPPDGYLREAKRVCNKHGILFILDEIQTGLGRTGKLFAWQHEGEEARPDCIILGKALGGGEDKMSVFVGPKEVLDVLSVGIEGSTFGGDPSSCALAFKSLQLLQDPKLLNNADELGSWFLKRLKSIDSQLKKEVRGKGLLIGVELTKEAGSARAICEALLDVNILTKDTHETVIRLTPPLVITKKELEWAFERIKYVFENI